MSDTALHTTSPFAQPEKPFDGENLKPIILELLVSDPDSLRELLQKGEGRERNEYALAALRIGLLSLRHARGQTDAEAVKHEGERLLADLKHALEHSRSEIQGDLTSALEEYFDPTSGRFQERVDRLIKQDGELEQVLKRQIGSEGSELAATLAAHIGGNSPLMKLLNPEESDGLVSAMRSAIFEVVAAERERILGEFSLDNKQGALSRLVGELAQENGELKQGFADEVQHVVAEFSLDREDSALSRLSAVVAGAKEAIDANLTLDTDDSALSRLKREVVAILERHEDKVGAFQTSVQAALEAMKAQREEAARSTRHGDDFEDVAADFIQKEVRKAGDVPSRTGTTVGSIKNCKKGDLVVELGSDCVAAGERFVVEAKEDESYKLADARAEIEIARKNRETSVGLFVFSKKTCPDELEALFRDGNDVFVVWDAY